MNVVDRRVAHRVRPGQEDLVSRLEQLPLPGFEAWLDEEHIRLRRTGIRGTIKKTANGEGGRTNAP